MLFNSFALILEDDNVSALSTKTNLLHLLLFALLKEMLFVLRRFTGVELKEKTFESFSQCTCIFFVQINLYSEKTFV